MLLTARICNVIENTPNNLTVDEKFDLNEFFSRFSVWKASAIIACRILK